MNEQFTPEGRRILEETARGGELQQLIETVHGPSWICTCGNHRCEHLERPHRRKDAEHRDPGILKIALWVGVIVLAAYLIVH